MTRLLTVVQELRCNQRFGQPIPLDSSREPTADARCRSSAEGSSIDSSSPSPASTLTPKRRGLTAGQVLVVTSVMFTFISFWRTAAIVLCDLASTAYYIGGIVESQIGAAAPWFILAVMIFSYAVRSVYIESCALFVRGGVYRIVKEAMGGGLARLAVSALLFDYILTGPISGVTAGQYIVGLLNDVLGLGKGQLVHGPSERTVGSDRDRRRFLLLASQRQGHPRIERPGASDHGRDDCHGRRDDHLVPGDAGCPIQRQRTFPRPVPDLSKKVDAEGKPMLDPFGKQVDPLGYHWRDIAWRGLRPERINGHWWSLIGVIGIVLSFGHSILAMSGEETLAQVYREVESPKLKNFKRAALVVFLYSLLFTSLISFFAVMIIPDGCGCRVQRQLDRRAWP